MPRLKFGMVCYSNQNRSMEAHKVLQEAGFDVVSYGVGTCVRLPGPNRFEPNVYEFGTPYKAILADLRSKPAADQPHYERLGLISMLERNMKVRVIMKCQHEMRGIAVNVKMSAAELST